MLSNQRQSHEKMICTIGSNKGTSEGHMVSLLHNQLKEFKMSKS